MTSLIQTGHGQDKFEITLGNTFNTATLTNGDILIILKRSNTAKPEDFKSVPGYLSSTRRRKFYG